MSQLEVRAQRVLQPLLLGDSTGVDSAGQATIALWTLKTAMVLEALDRPHLRAYRALECERLRVAGEIPWRTSVWLAASADASSFMSTKNRHLDAENATDITGVSITMAFAHVVLQVFTMRLPETVGPSTHVTANVRRGPWDQATIQIWPARSIQASWPPPVGLNGESGLDALADRFMTAELDDDAIESMAV